MERTKNAARAFRSRKGLRDLLATNEGDMPSSRWINNDLRPTPPGEFRVPQKIFYDHEECYHVNSNLLSLESRTWTWFHLPLFWSGLAFGTTGWNIASSLIAVGLVCTQHIIIPLPVYIPMIQRRLF